MATLVQRSAPEEGARPELYVSPRSHRSTAIFLLLFSSVLYLGTSFYPSLLDDADSSHAVVAREMLTRGDYVIMYMNGIRYLMKAPLQYWLVAFDYKIFGPNAFATRLPVALSMIGLVLLLYEFGRRFFSPKAGLYAALAGATSVGMFMFTRIMIPEAIYALLFTLTFYLFLRAWTGSLDTRIGCWAAAVSIGLAVLARGLIGLLFPVAGIVLFVIVTGSWRRWRDLHLFSSALIVLAIALPWHLLAELRSPGFLWSFIVNEHFNRALGTRWPPDYDAVPLWLWWLEHLAWFFPWSVFLGFALRQFVPFRRWRNLNTVEEQARLLLWIWAGFILLFFSVEHGSRMEYYAFGAWPAIALLIGLGLARAEQNLNSRRWLLRSQAALAILGMVIAAVLLVLVVKSLAVQKQDIAGLLKTHENDFYRVSMAHMFDLTPQAFADLRLPATLAALGLGLAFAIAWLMRRRGNTITAAIAMAFGMAVFFVAADLAYGAFQPLLSSRGLADRINQSLRPQDQLAIYGDFDDTSSVAFYTGRRVWIYNGLVNNLVYGAHPADVAKYAKDAPRERGYLDAPHIFFGDDDFHNLWNRPERVFIVIPELQRSNALARIRPLGAWLFAEAGGKMVLTNQAVTPDEPKL